MPQIVEFVQPRDEGVPRRTLINEFTELPPLSVFFTRGGVPGVRYAYVLLANLIEFQRGGWEQLNPPITFTVQGVPMACLGAGEPIRGVSTHSRRPELFIDKAAKQALATTSAKETSDASKQSPASVSIEAAAQGQDRPERVLRRQAPIE